MNELTVFENSEFGKLEIIKEGETFLFPATECAKMLGYTNPQKAIRDHCPHLTKRSVGVVTGKKADGSPAMQNVEKSYISEGDLYRLIVHSTLPGAVKFEKWVFDEVLPSIRKHGAYMTDNKLEDVLSDPDSWIKLLTALKEERAKKEKLKEQVDADKPKVLFADAVSASEGTILIGELAKILKGNGVEIGQNRLFGKLRQEGYLIKRKGTDYNMPSQKSMDLGLFRIKETSVVHSDGHITISKTTKITGRGQTYFVNKFLSETEKAI
jgi:anti-repressor protein